MTPCRSCLSSRASFSGFILRGAAVGSQTPNLRLRLTVTWQRHWRQCRSTNAFWNGAVGSRRRKDPLTPTEQRVPVDGTDGSPSGAMIAIYNSFRP